MKTFAEKYPYIDAWVQDAKIEIGYGEYDKVFIRAIDQGGVAFESSTKFSSMEEAFTALDKGIAKWCKDIGLEFDFE